MPLGQRSPGEQAESARPRPSLVLAWIAAMTISMATLLAVQFHSSDIFRGWDAQFYFALTHSLVFDGDMDVTNDFEESPYSRLLDADGDGHLEKAPRGVNGRIASKYPIGLSLVEAPFLLAGSAARRIAGVVGLHAISPPGYSRLEIWSVALGLLSIASLAIAALYFALAGWYGSRAAAAATAGAWMGTSLFYYSSVFPFMAQATSFALLVAIFHVTRRWPEVGLRHRTVFLLGLCLGFLLLVRPQQMVIGLALVPLLIQASRRCRLADWMLGGLGGVAAILLAAAVQMSSNQTQWGRFVLSGYEMSGEGFAWLSPDLQTVVTSPSRGALVFSPVMLLAAAGLARFWRAVPPAVVPHVWNFLAQIYLVAAWSTPDQGDSFGARMLSDNALVVAVGLAVLHASTRPSRRWAIVAIIVACLAWTIWLMLAYMRVL